MKKAMALILSLVVCFSLAACSKANKYVGTYVSKGALWETSANTYKPASTETTMILNEDGTGTIERVVTEEGKYSSGKRGVKVGDVVSAGTVSWTTDKEYISITFNSKKYYYNYHLDGDSMCAGDGQGIEIFELKVNQLFNVESGNAEYTKVS